MNKIIKSLLLAIGLTASVTALAQGDATPVMRAYPLLNGYNVMVATSGYANLNATNVEFTFKQGQIWFSYNGITNGVWDGNTNQYLPNVAPVQPVELKADLNGDINANASLTIYVNNTNYIPVAVLSNFNSAASLVIATNWPLAAGSWLAGTNTYPLVDGANNSILQLSLYTSAEKDLGQASMGMPSAMNVMSYPWETTPSFQCSFTMSGGPQCFTTNLPAAFLQHARWVYLAITNQAVATPKSVNTLVNQVLLLQPQK